MVTRSLRADVRNPLVLMPEFQALRDLPEPARLAVKNLLRGIRTDARAKAETCWRRHKAPMAAYWKAVSVYAGHAGKALR